MAPGNRMDSDRWAFPMRRSPRLRQKILRLTSRGCFARNSALRAALDPATDDLLFDIVINPCGVRAHRRPPAAYPLRARAPSCAAAAGAHVDSFASMLLYVLRLRSAEKSKKSSKSNDVTLLPMESGFFLCSLKSAAAVHTPQSRHRIFALPGVRRARQWRRREIGSAARPAQFRLRLPQRRTPIVRIWQLSWPLQRSSCA